MQMRKRIKKTGGYISASQSEWYRFYLRNGGDQAANQYWSRVEKEKNRS